MLRLLLALLFSAQLVSISAAQNKPKDGEPTKEPPKKLVIAEVLKTVQSAYAKSSSPALLAMTTADFQKNMTATTLGAVLGAWKARYGKWDDHPEKLKQAGAVHTYRIKAERGVLHLRLIFDDSHYLGGIGLAPSFLDNLPSSVDMPAV